MEVEVVRHALDRVPLAINIEDSTVLLNLNYFLLRDRKPRNDRYSRWEDMPVVHPESFAREFAEWCHAHGVRGKFSVVPCPAALGRIDEGLPLLSRAQMESWLAMCRDVITPVFDITPEMMTHTFVVDLETFRPLPSGIWESADWAVLPEDQEDMLVDYVAAACRILDNVGLTPQGVSGPGGFGGRTLELLAKISGLGNRRVTGNPTPYFLKRFLADGPVDAPVWHADREAGTAVGEVQVCTVAWTGPWTGYGEAEVDKYITADLQGGRLPAVIDAGDPAVICSHWQAMYGMHNDDRHGFDAFQTVVRRLKERDPNGERTQWRKCSEIAGYACARQMAEVTVEGRMVRLDLPVRAPDFTLRLRGGDVYGVSVDGKPLAPAVSRAAFKSGRFFREGGATLVAFDPEQRQPTVEVRGDGIG